MKSNLFKQFCGFIDCNTYNKIQEILGVSSASMILVHNLSLLSKYSLLNSSFNVLMDTSLIAYIVFNSSYGIECTKDVMKIRSLYQEFITNYNQLNKVFDLNDPIQIHTMFNYLLYKGYLSVNKNFEFSSKEARDIKSLYGVNVLLGKGVCRHISCMLVDILNHYGIESYQLGVYSMGINVNVNFLEFQKYSKEELSKWVQKHIIDEKAASTLLSLIEKLVDEYGENIEFSTEMVEDKNRLKRMIGNHSITFSVQDGKSYYLDPTQTRIYRVKENDKNVLYDEERDRVPIRLLSSVIMNNVKNYLKMRKRISQQYPCVTMEEEQHMVEQTMKNCVDNMDIFEQFYSENSDLYRDISSKMLKIKKSKIL